MSFTCKRARWNEILICFIAYQRMRESTQWCCQWLKKVTATSKKMSKRPPATQPKPRPPAVAKTVYPVPKDATEFVMTRDDKVTECEKRRQSSWSSPRNCGQCK